MPPKIRQYSVEYDGPKKDIKYSIGTKSNNRLIKNIPKDEKELIFSIFRKIDDSFVDFVIRGHILKLTVPSDTATTKYAKKIEKKFNTNEETDFSILLQTIEDSKKEKRVSPSPINKKKTNRQTPKKRTSLSNEGKEAYLIVSNNYNGLVPYVFYIPVSKLKEADLDKLEKHNGQVFASISSLINRYLEYRQLPDNTNIIRVFTFI